MSRASSNPQTITVAPSNNVYTVIAGIGCVAVGIALIVLFIRAGTLDINLMNFGL